LKPWAKKSEQKQGGNCFRDYISVAAAACPGALYFTLLKPGRGGHPEPLVMDLTLSPSENMFIVGFPTTDPDQKN